jgi:beta-lactamase regulating signal transducer with metallopeptidase domain
VIDPLLDAPLVQSIGWALIHFVWQGSAIGIAAALALRVLASARPTLRYAVACCSLALMLIVPVAAVLTDRAPDSAAVTSMAAASVAVVPPVPVDRLLPATVAVWLAGVFLLSIRLIVACAGVERLKRATRAVDATVVARVQLLAHRFGIGRPVRVFESTLVRVPAVVGCLRPVILLPASVITGLAPSHLDAVLAHELAHVRRHDYLVNVLQSLVETLLFYHPAVWWCSRQIRIEREHCCDDMVVEAGGDRVTYAAALAQLEELRGLEPMLSLNASGGRLLDRVRRLLGESPAQERRSATWTIAVALTVVASMMAMPALTVADASERVVPLRSEQSFNEPDRSAYVREAQTALETLARETPGIAVLPELSTPQSAPRPQPQPTPQPAARAKAQSAPQPAPQPEAQSVPQPATQPRVAPKPQSSLPLWPQPPLPPAPPTPAPLGAPPGPPVAAPVAPAPPLPPSSQTPALAPAPPSPPAPPVEPLGLDADSIGETMRSAMEQIAASLKELRQATEDVGLKQEAIRQAQAELAKMRIESLATRTQIEAMQRTLSEFSAKNAAAQIDRDEMQKLIKELNAELAKLRAR